MDENNTVVHQEHLEDLVTEPDYDAAFRALGIRSDEELTGTTMETLIFEKSRAGRRAFAQAPTESSDGGIPEALQRNDVPALPEASELQVVRHYTRLSQQNFSIDTQFYPLGSCTMKYNPRACNGAGFAARFCRSSSSGAGQSWPGLLAVHV